MGAVSLKSFVELTHQGIDAVLHHVDLADEGRGFVGIEFIAARGFRQRVLEERLHDHILRDSPLLQSLAGCVERAIYKVAIRARENVTEGSVVVRISHSNSISDRRLEKQISTQAGCLRHAR